MPTCSEVEKGSDNHNKVQLKSKPMKKSKPKKGKVTDAKIKPPSRCRKRRAHPPQQK